MQPYILPYIGYFQLINYADLFVVYDNIEFTKKGWINRNRIIGNGKEEYLSLPIKKDSDFLHINKRVISEDFDKIKLLRKIKESYKKAPYFFTVFSLLEDIINNKETNLFKFIFNSLEQLCEYLEIKTKFIKSSDLIIDHSLKSQDKVIAICTHLNASEYINPIGGVELYSKEVFEKNNILLKFLKASAIEYKQFSNEFIPWLSIIDVMMFNPKETVQYYLQSSYTII